MVLEKAAVAALLRLANAVHNNSLYFCTVFVQMQDNLMCLGYFLAAQ
jgi:hypothetical protein